VSVAELWRAAVLGTVSGSRTFLAPAALALRGRLGKVGRFALPVLAAGELVGDKLPGTPPRSEGPALIGRVVSGAIAGRVSGGSRGLRVGAAFALASTYPSQLLRAEIVKRTPVPDIACAVPEDIIGAALAAAASSEPRPDPGDLTPTSPGSERRHGIVAAAAVAGGGLAAGAVGVGAMVSAQNWVAKLTGGELVVKPDDLAKRIALGLPFGLLATRGGRRSSGPIDGIALGLAACALDVAEHRAFEPVDLAFHLVYGVAASAALEALTT
jgi:uncharacterized membrane protein